MSEEHVNERRENYIDSFQRFVTKNKLSTEDKEEIAKWCKSQRYVYLTIYDNDKLVFETEIDEDDITWSEILASGKVKDENGDIIMPSAEFTLVRFDENGSEKFCRVSLAEFSETDSYNVATLLSVSTCFALFIVSLIVYINRITKKVVRLAGEVDKIEHGNLEQKIEYSGNDELAMLSENVDRMRLSIIEQLNNKEIAWKANNELITSLSHDFRNPLTSLIGYLEILNGGLYESESEREEFLNACMGKASQLKDLSDALFQYFLVFGAQEITVRPEEYDAGILFEQLFGEPNMYLESHGFRVKYKPFVKEDKINVDVQLLKRVIDNLVSNVIKYAEPGKEVSVSVEEEGNYIKIEFVNQLKTTPANVTSTKIGLKTCDKIITQMGGEFYTKKGTRHFYATVLLPR